MLILGIDVGFARIGWGLIHKCNKLNASNRCDECERFKLKDPTQTTLSRSKSKQYYYLDSGLIETTNSQSYLSRLIFLAEQLSSTLEKYKPDEVAVEELFFFKNHKTVIQVAEARGVILLTCKDYKIFEYTPLQVKQTLTGAGRAEKKQVQEMTRRLLNLDQGSIKQDDEADAVAIALTHGFQSRINSYN